jgi:hypothetical protein
MRTPSYWGRIKTGIKIKTLSPAEIYNMRKVLISEAKPIYEAKLRKGDIIERFAMDYYDERINTLPRNILYDIYNAFTEYKNAHGKSFEDTAYIYFHMHLTTAYSLEGWFIKKLLRRR